MIYSDKQYKMAFKELDVILKYIPRHDYLKIPKTTLQVIEDNKDDTYNFEIDFSKDLYGQTISELTKALIANFYRDYWITDIEREKILQEENFVRQSLEEEKRIKYNPDDIFKNREKNIQVKAQELVVVKEKTFLERILQKLKKIFNNR